MVSPISTNTCSSPSAISNGRQLRGSCDRAYKYAGDLPLCTPVDCHLPHRESISSAITGGVLASPLALEGNPTTKVGRGIQGLSHLPPPMILVRQYQLRIRACQKDKGVNQDLRVAPSSSRPVSRSRIWVVHTTGPLTRTRPAERWQPAGGRPGARPKEA